MRATSRRSHRWNVALATEEEKVAKKYFLREQSHKKLLIRRWCWPINYLLWSTWNAIPIKSSNFSIPSRRFGLLSGNRLHCRSVFIFKFSGSSLRCCEDSDGHLNILKDFVSLSCGLIRAWIDFRFDLSTQLCASLSRSTKDRGQYNNPPEWNPIRRFPHQLKFTQQSQQNQSLYDSSKTGELEIDICEDSQRVRKKKFFAIRIYDDFTWIKIIKRGLWENLLINQFIPKLYSFLVSYNANRFSIFSSSIAADFWLLSGREAEKTHKKQTHNSINNFHNFIILRATTKTTINSLSLIVRSFFNQKYKCATLKDILWFKASSGAEFGESVAGDF